MNMRRAISADWLIFGDGRTPALNLGAVVVDESNAVEFVGQRDEVRAQFSNLPIEISHGVLLPGLVNAHVRLSHAVLKSRVAGGGGYIPWIAAAMSAIAAVDESEASAAVDDALVKLAAHGTVAIGEVGTSLATAHAVARSRLHARIFREVPGVRADVAEVTLGMAVEEHEETAAELPQISMVLAVHGLSTTHPDLVKTLNAMARDESVRTTMPLLAHAAERAFLSSHSGPFAEFLRARRADPPDWNAPNLSPTEHALACDALGPWMIASHLTHATKDELRAFANTGAHAVLCPRSALHIETRLPALDVMLAEGLQPALGTDSIGATADYDVLQESAALHVRFPTLSAATLIAMATGFGAKTLGFDDLVGSISPGKKPGILHVASAVAITDEPEKWLLRNVSLPRRRLV